MTGGIEGGSDVELADLEAAVVSLKEAPTSWYGHVIKDWSQIPLYLCGAGACVVAGVAGATYYVSQNIFVAIAASATGVGGTGLCLGAFRIGMLKPRKTQEKQLELYESYNMELLATKKVFEKDIKDFKQANDDLQATFDKYKLEKGKLEKNLGDNVTRLEKTATLLKKTQEKLKVLEELYKQFKQKTKSFASDLGKLAKTNKKIAENQDELAGKVDDLDKQEDELSEEIDQLVDATEYKDKQQIRMTSVLDSLKENIAVVDLQFSSMKKEFETLQASIEHMDKVDDKFLIGAEKVEHAAGEFNEGLDKILGALDDSDS